MDHYDYVIIGAGSAGSVMADKLSADERHRVLVLEAGPADTDERIAVPQRWIELAGSEVDWAYRTAPQAHAAGREIFWPRGRVVGGSSSINAMVHLRGAAADFDEWAEQGCDGWGYDSALPTFKEYEDFEGGEAGFHGRGGALKVSMPHDVHPLSEAAVAAAIGRGHPANDDFNGSGALGVGWNPLTVRDGRRQSAAEAFLTPALGRPNLTLITDALVTRLVTEKGKAIAVDYIVDGRAHRVGIDGEVVLSAGSIETPKLLLLSGIGPAADLRALGIDVAFDAPGVGANLHDHPGVGITFSSKQPVPFGHNQHSELGMFANVVGTPRKPQVQFGLVLAPHVAEGMDAPATGFTFYPSWTTPLSRGTVTLRSVLPSDRPIVDPHYLEEEADLDGLVAAIELSREWAHAPELAEWTDQEVLPGPDVTDRAGLRDYVRRAVGTWFHPVGTARMGSDEQSVVDTQLRLRGFDNVRVVDASVMPTVTTANTNAPTLMIAHRASAMMLAAGVESARAASLAGASS